MLYRIISLIKQVIRNVTVITQAALSSQKCSWVATITAKSSSSFNIKCLWFSNNLMRVPYLRKADFEGLRAHLVGIYWGTLKQKSGVPQESDGQKSGGDVNGEVSVERQYTQTWLIKFHRKKTEV